MESSGLSIREMKGLEDPNGLKCLAEEDSEYMDQVTREVTVGRQTRTKLTGVATRTRQVSSYRYDDCLSCRIQSCILWNSSLCYSVQVV